MLHNACNLLQIPHYILSKPTCIRIHQRTAHKQSRWDIEDAGSSQPAAAAPNHGPAAPAHTVSCPIYSTSNWDTTHNALCVSKPCRRRAWSQWKRQHHQPHCEPKTKWHATASGMCWLTTFPRPDNQRLISALFTIYVTIQLASNKPEHDGLLIDSLEIRDYLYACEQYGWWCITASIISFWPLTTNIYVCVEELWFILFHILEQTASVAITNQELRWFRFVAVFTCKCVYIYMYGKKRPSNWSISRKWNVGSFWGKLHFQRRS